jgi:hypothetical protein
MPVGFPDYYGGLTLPVTVQEGGTGQTSITSKAMLYGAGTSQLIETNVGSSGQVLQINSVTLVPTFQPLTGTALTPPLQLTPYQQDALLVGDSSDLPAARGAFEIAAPSGSIVNPFIVSIATTQLLNFSPAGNLIIAGSLTLGSPLAKAQGGTGTASPALVAGTAISITGSWPNNTINNTSAYASLADPLAIAHGGTGLTSPSLVAGSNIDITGSWPNHTIALHSPPFFGSGGVATGTAFNIGTDTTGSGHAQFGTHQGAVQGVTADLLNIADPGVAWRLAFDKSGNLGIAGKLACGNIECSLITKYNSITLVGDGVPYLVATVNLTGQSGNGTETTLYTPSAAGQYCVSTSLFNHNTSASSDALAVQIIWTQNGHTFNKNISDASTAAGSFAEGHDVITIYADASTAIKYQVVLSSGTAPSWDVHIRLEKI